MAAGAAAVASGFEASAQGSLGSLIWVQPDGLWIRALPGGQTAKIASGNRLHNPRFSPTGQWVSYSDGDEKQFVIRRDGGSPVSFDAEKTVWLPQDRLVVAYEHETHVLSGADAWKSPVTAWKNEGLPLYSPGGHEYARWEIHERPADAYGLNRDKTELYIAPAAVPERKSRVLIGENEGAIEVFAWTRDGKSLIYWRADEWSGSLWSDGVDLYTIPAAGGPERKLGMEALAHDDMLDLAPKSNLLAVTRGRYRETWCDQQIAVADLDTGAIRNLTSSSVSALCPAWSPDGRTIAYTAAPNGGHLGGGEKAHDNLHLRKIWQIDPGGTSAPRQITNDPHYRDEEPMWSADGLRILFGRMDGHASLWPMDRDGSHATHICPVEVYDDMGLGDNWFGFYGYIDWRSAFDWRR